ncbi:acetyl-CoA C-acetyltransferase [Diaminobutyricimonas sp. LJ205]|uniref:acetyl-CoA C-acetyltransferase n=1 Tax=Diaminobutyricimonas sp. LJ205 TaxID=2683590 RepID=UPI0012F4A1B7|nr:acetyl-CoA C-acetyltransferase [Diaminobutyricimonas sp. LJ205]
MSTQNHTAVIISGARTPFAKINGSLASITASELGAHAIKAALEAGGVPAKAIDAVIMGQVIQAGSGQGPARQASIGAGIGWDVPTVTINKLCLSGLTAVIDAARLIRAGDARVVVAGGQESMSNAPHLLLGSRKAHPYGSQQLEDAINYDGLVDPFEKLIMGEATDDGNATRKISREAQDAFAAASHQRAARSRAAGVFAEQIAPISVPQRRGEPVLVSEDDGIRPDTTSESLSRLRPAFRAAGTITAGSSSQLTDGAAALVVASKDWAIENGYEWIAEIGASGQVAGPDGSLHSQPANAIKQALAKEGTAVAALDVVEINEAFASVVLQSADDLDIDPAIVNVDGGAIALGHPVGASGARLALHLAYALKRRGGGAGVVALCGGGGQGEALVLRVK